MKPYDFIENKTCMIKTGQPTLITKKDGTSVKGTFVTRRTLTRQIPKWVLIEKINDENEKIHYISEDTIEDICVEPFGKPFLSVVNNQQAELHIEKKDILFVTYDVRKKN